MYISGIAEEDGQLRSSKSTAPYVRKNTTVSSRSVYQLKHAEVLLSKQP